MASRITDIEALEVLAALIQSSALSDKEREAIRAVQLLAARAIVEGWKPMNEKDIEA